MEHKIKTNHGILFDQAKVLANIPHYYPIFVKEAIEINKRRDSFNKNYSIRLPKTRNPILYQFK